MRSIPRITQEGERVYCGPAALALLTGYRVDHVVDLLKRVTRRKKITFVYLNEMEWALRAMGYEVTVTKTKKPLRLCFTRAIYLTGRHYVVKDGLMIGDQHQVTLWANHWARRQRPSYMITIKRPDWEAQRTA